MTVYSEPKTQDKIKSMNDFITDLERQGKLTKLCTGILKGKEPLNEEEMDPKELSISSYYQRQFSTTALNSYKIYNPQLVRHIVVAVRPQKLGGHQLVIDGQHTVALALYSKSIDTMKSMVLRHPESRSLDECIRVEAELFHAYNTARKNPTMIDKYRAGLCFDDPDAVRFHTRLVECNLQCDGLGDVDGDLLSTNSATRFDKCVKQFDDKKKADYGHYINKAVNYIRNTWGTPKKNITKDDKGNEIVTEYKYRDDLIHGLTTLLVLIDVGRSKNCAYLTDKTKQDFNEWLETYAHLKTVEQYTHNTGGGNTHYKIAHRFLQEYNTHGSYNSISHKWAHENGVWDEEVLRVSGKSRMELLAKPESRGDKSRQVKNGEYRTAAFPLYSNKD